MMKCYGGAADIYFQLQSGECRRIHSTTVLAYFVLQLDMTAEDGAGRDEANHVSTSVHGSCPNPVA